MALREGDKHNFQTLLRAAQNGDLALVESRRTSDGTYVALLAIVYQEQPGGEYVVVPLGEMTGGDPYQLYEDPTKYGRISPKDWSPRKGKKKK